MLQIIFYNNLFYTYLPNPQIYLMEIFTEKEALELIFQTHKNNTVYRVYKNRYKRGVLKPSTIEKILLKHKFIASQIALYKKSSSYTNSIHIELEPNMFDLIFRSKVTSIEIDKTKYEHLISDKLSFLRFTYKKWYMDVNIRKVIITDNILIHLSSIIDYNKPKQ